MREQIATKTNIVLATVFICANFFALFWLPVLAHIQIAWLYCWIPVILMTQTQWALIHEAIHCLFNKNKQVNFYLGRLLSLSIGTEFHIVRFGHLLHHRFNRTSIDLTEGYNPARISRWVANLRYYMQICFGLYLSEIVTPILFLLPKTTVTKLAKKIFKQDDPYYSAINQLLQKSAKLAEIRLDTFIMLAIWIMSFYLYGHLWWILLSVTLVRGFIVSFADNLPHYGTRTDDVLYAYNLFLPKVLQKLILNFNLHRVHHHHPNIPWQLLPTHFSATEDHYDINYFKQGLYQWQGVIPIEKLPKV